ncbi:MAG: TonB-dependent receptor [Rubrivivax sp.]|nr:TonB-dependent receptor [Rubrivivax sp.]
MQKASRHLAGRRARLAVPLTATATAVTCLFMAAAPAAAQTSDTVVVTGIRKAIEDAISVKRNADTIVEAISAEDIGKLPDASVAESISRLPGIATQRSSVTGRAQDISVRGMSPDFNGGVLNGREQASTSTSRALQFDQFPAELVSGVTIHKTADASLLNQGLSSTINMTTARPLDFSRRNVVINVRGEKANKAENLPGFKAGSGDRESLSYIDQFADRKLGLVLGYSRSKNTGATQPDMQTWGGWTPTVPYNGQDVTVPGGFTSRINDTTEKREAAIATLQYKPHKDFETSVDVLWSKGTFTLDRFGLEGPLGGLSAGANDTGGRLVTAVVSNGIATSGTFDNWKGVINNHFNDYTDELKSLGWNLRTKVGAITLTGDLSHSENKRNLLRYETTLGLPGNTAVAGDTISFSGFNGTNLTQVKYTGGLNYADPNIIKLTDVQGWAGGESVQDGYYATPTTKDKVQSARFGARADVDWGPIARIDGGLNYSDRTKDRTTIEGALVLNGAVDAAGNVINRLAAATAPNSFTGYGGTTGIPTVQWNPRGSLGPIYRLNTWSDPDILGKNWGVKEEVTTAFVKGDIDAQLGGVSLRGNVGVQFVNTKQSATGVRVDRESCNGGAHTCTYTNLANSHSYTDTLPSLNLIADLGGGQLLRTGLGRVISRPQMEDMRAGVDYSYNSTTQRWTGTAGNPKLEPFRADALDVSYEKYFGSKGYVSVAGFYKDLKTYILRSSRAFDFSSYLSASQAREHPVSSRDLVTQPLNGTGGTIKGIELAVNIPLSLLTPALDGFGILLNHSDTDSSVELPVSGFATSNVGTVTIPLPGLSRRVTNLRAYYEKGGLQVAVAARKRSPFLGTISDFQDNNQLVFIKGETTVDVQLAYEFKQGMLKGLTVLAQGTNVTNAPYIELNPSNNSETVNKKFGAVYMLGASYKF